MIERVFTRPQNVLRSFFGLGPSQIGLLDTILPTIDVDNYAVSFQEQQLLTVTGAVVAPGASQNLQLTLPRTGYWLIDHVGVSSTGPVTSGSIANLTLGILYQRGNVTAFLGLLDGERTLTKVGAFQEMLGVRLRPALVLFFLPNALGQIGDQIVASFNAPGANVGNVQLTITALARQLELAQV